MKIKLDENVSQSLCSIFAAHGGQADTAYSEGLGGSTDEVLFNHALKENRLLVTCDLDFADIRRFPPSSTGGILVLRLANRSAISVANRIDELLKTIDISKLRGSTTIVMDDRIRMRKCL